jgi:hypothetical protein
MNKILDKTNHLRNKKTRTVEIEIQILKAQLLFIFSGNEDCLGGLGSSYNNYPLNFWVWALVTPLYRSLLI